MVGDIEASSSDGVVCDEPHSHHVGAAPDGRLTVRAADLTQLRAVLGASVPDEQVVVVAAENTKSVDQYCYVLQKRSVGVRKEAFTLPGYCVQTTI